MIQDIRIEKPADCLTMVKAILDGCFEKLQKEVKRDDTTTAVDPAKDYEGLLQQAESKIRMFIRVYLRRLLDS